MEDFEAPSFSLGIDVDFDSESRAVPREDLVCRQGPESLSNVSFQVFEDDDDFQVQNLDPVIHTEDSPPVLKRLKRGPATQLPAVNKPQPTKSSLDVDDDIEEFSSQEEIRRGETVGCSAVQKHCASNSSKSQLHCRSVLTSQSVSMNKVKKHIPSSIASTSANLEGGDNKLMFPKLTVSPLRRFQLLDSDSDEPSSSEDLCQDAGKNDADAKEKQCSPDQYMMRNQPKRPNSYASTFQTEDLWKDFSPKKNPSIPTPALDKFCDEYFMSVKDKNVVQMDTGTSVSISKDYQKSSISENVKHLENLPSPLPPAYQYFYHEDIRIQKLVRERLPNFFPLDDVNNRGHKHSGVAAIDYMSQFGQRACPQPDRAGNKAPVGSSRRSKMKVKRFNAKEVSQPSEDWVNPQSSACMPKNAGKRRVHAEGHSTGQWYTGQDGKRVYVTKNGQELMGRIAYLHYRKESGKGLKKPTKKATAKKKTKG
ncbi:uncharacterized protein LOC122092849 [Macadamia integrifolia]|uniref:uncharacterized protein LOC122092849 n=1 Tax=Macadamia integrifolia TaxID=60698 RepID=UPI001C52FAD8|nr:uncharacterized protein LOC122092849 [Macadamia integrifolia]XP_042519081.1 uncharacterized protein LOC122092849 [Macadamia integrifolia]